MKKTILLIEDDNIVRDNTAEILMLASYNVITAKDGKEGVKKALDHKPDLIICDILMPELDGYGVLQIILRNKDLQRTPFIFMTAKTKHEDLRKGMDLGACDYITKPFEESELLSAIESRLKRKEIFKRKSNEEENNKNKIASFKDIKKYFSHKEKFKYGRGTSIYCEGNNSNHIFFIINGEVKTVKNNEEGKEFITDIFREQSFFGFTSFVQNKPYHESAISIAKTTLIKITKAEFLELVKHNPQLAINFLDILSENLKNVKSHLIHLAYDSVRKKTADTLLQLNSLNNNVDSIEVSRSNLASLIGIAKETLIRTLTEFRDEKVIETKRNSIKIIDIKKLKKIK
ncbi:MAG: response regulator [Bacteroidota bacterium]